MAQLNIHEKYLKPPIHEDDPMKQNYEYEKILDPTSKKDLQYIKEHLDSIKIYFESVEDDFVGEKRRYLDLENTRFYIYDKMIDESKLTEEQKRKLTRLKLKIFYGDFIIPDTELYISLHDAKELIEIIEVP